MEIRISYETLFDVLRREKGREDLQELDDSFFKDVVSYMKDKQAVLESGDEMFGQKEKASVSIQMENIRKIVKELYDRRENKIVRLAQDKAGSGKTNASALLPEEKGLFDALLQVFVQGRDCTLNRILAMKQPSEVDVSLSSCESVDQKEDSGVKMVRFLHPLPKFLGKDRSVYGPYDEDEVASLPEEIAVLLAKKGRAEVIDAR